VVGGWWLVVGCWLFFQASRKKEKNEIKKKIRKCIKECLTPIFKRVPDTYFLRKK